MSSSERLDPIAGPVANLSQAFFGGFDVLAKGYEPTLKSAGRLNLELINLMSRRAHAWMEIPAVLGRCMTPQDLISEQLKFWQNAASHYSEGSQRLVSALGSCAVMPGLNGAWSAKAPAQRDYITFPEPKENSHAASEKRSDRRAA